MREYLAEHATEIRARAAKHGAKRDAWQAVLDGLLETLDGWLSDIDPEGLLCVESTPDARRISLLEKSLSVQTHAAGRVDEVSFAGREVIVHYVATVTGRAGEATPVYHRAEIGYVIPGAATAYRKDVVGVHRSGKLPAVEPLTLARFEQFLNRLRMSREFSG